MNYKTCCATEKHLFFYPSMGVGVVRAHDFIKAMAAVAGAPSEMVEWLSFYGAE